MRVIDELGIDHGAIRLDIALVNSIFQGFELKSDNDSLIRLPNQMRAYNAVLDRVTLVVGYRHAYEALKIIPEWWGVKLVEIGPFGGVHFSQARMPRNNPKPDPLAIARLLWRDEAIELLSDLGAAQGVLSKSRSYIYGRIVEVTDLDTIRARVRRQLMCRVNWRSDAEQTLHDD
jgi:hypothetical protein